jgi:hypothetical protein
VSESDTDTYTVSFKTHGGYDASLVVVRGNTVQELSDNLNATFDDLFSLVVDAENLLHTAHAAKSPTPAAAAPAPAASAPAASPSGAADTGVVHMCTHGKRTRREGTGAKGKWVGHFCPTPKGTADQCKPVWED